MEDTSRAITDGGRRRGRTERGLRSVALVGSFGAQIYARGHFSAYVVILRACLFTAGTRVISPIQRPLLDLTQWKSRDPRPADLTVNLVSPIHRRMPLIDQIH
jgi:hypothetical protein